MDSEQFFFIDEELNVDFSGVQELSLDKLKCIEHYVEISRHLQEIHQLYQIVLFNLRIMRHNYLWISNGEILYGEMPAKGDEHFIAVNSMIINLVGSARTLTESMDCYIKENYDSESSNAQSYRNFSSSIYDSSFAYRFLIRLRDFSQHGHPPVSQNDANYAFDLRQILEMPHFAHNKLIKEQISAAVTEIMEGFSGSPRLSVTMTVAEFTVGLWQVYDYFLTCVEAHLRESFVQTQEIMAQYPDNIILKTDDFSGLFVYAIKDGHAHVFTVGEDTMEMLRKFQLEAKGTLEDFQEDWEQLKKDAICMKRDRDNFVLTPV